VLYSFTGEADGALPGGNDLVLDRNGYLYGIAQHGGDTSCALGCGAAFRITPDGKMSVLHTFRGSRDGGVPTGIAAGRHGEFYVTTAQGGGSDCEFGCGTIFRISSKGAKSVFHEFQGSDGKEPVGGVLLDARGNMWVATYLGGAYGYGTVVELPSRGAEKVLHSFGGPDDSESPAGQLILENSILYGTTWAGGTGSCPCGTVFEITP
jgi:uncharacterized repeat protein (TIGR03803 family)